jgi:hypothetical protein
MATNKQLEALVDRMVDARHRLIFDAAEAGGGIPPEGALRKIAGLETAIRALEDLLEHRTGGAPGGSPHR